MLEMDAHFRMFSVGIRCSYLLELEIGWCWNKKRQVLNVFFLGENFQIDDWKKRSFGSQTTLFLPSGENSVRPPSSVRYQVTYSMTVKAFGYQLSSNTSICEESYNPNGSSGSLMQSSAGSLCTISSLKKGFFEASWEALNRQGHVAVL